MSTSEECNHMDVRRTDKRDEVYCYGCLHHFTLKSTHSLAASAPQPARAAKLNSFNFVADCGSVGMNIVFLVERNDYDSYVAGVFSSRDSADKWIGETLKTWGEGDYGNPPFIVNEYEIDPEVQQ